MTIELIQYVVMKVVYYLIFFTGSAGLIVGLLWLFDAAIAKILKVIKVYPLLVRFFLNYHKIKHEEEERKKNEESSSV